MTRTQRIKTSLFLAAASFLAIWLIVLLTSPIKNIAFAVPFFAALFVFLVSVAHLFLYLRWGEVSPRARSRILIISIFIVLLTMFKSAQSLNWIDALILLLVLGGLLFYSSSRA